MWTNILATLALTALCVWSVLNDKRDVRVQEYYNYIIIIKRNNKIMEYEQFIEVMMTNIGKIERYNEMKKRIGQFVTTNELVYITLK